ncbi:unnamed protein product [Rhizophagus irregularis]|nr:unnamed protein product [Rhizophagus irregularis]
MDNQIHHIYTFDNEYETILDLASDQILDNDNNVNLPLNQLNLPNQYINFQNNMQTISYWRPSSKLQILLKNFKITSYHNGLELLVRNASVPLYKRKHLSPVYLHCSLGRTPNSNPYSEYRSLTEPNNNDNNLNNDTMENQIHDETLKQAATWLSLNNPYLRPYAHILSSQSSEQNKITHFKS